jgi:hypothetical protein
MIAVPEEIKALQKRWRTKGSLSIEETQKLIDWQIQAVASEEAQAKQAGEVGTLKPDDLVEFVMPRTTQGGAYKLNRPWQGRCVAPYAVFVELMRMREQDILGLQELTQRRGEARLGTGLKDFIEYSVPPLTCRLVKRAADLAKEGKHAQAAA